MKTKFDLTNANAVIDEYLCAVRDVNQLPGKHSRVYVEILMQKHGIIKNWRGLSLGEGHALWFACLVATKRLREVSRVEVENKHARKDRTTERTVRRMLSDKPTIQRDNIIARYLREITAAI